RGLADAALRTRHQHRLHPRTPTRERWASVHRPRAGRDRIAAEPRRGRGQARCRSAIVAALLTQLLQMSDLQDLSALIRADTPLIVIETPDEARVVDLFRQSLLHVWRA